MPLKYNNLSPINPVGTDGEGLTFRYIQSLVHLCDQRGSETRYRVEPSGRRVTLQCRSGWVSAAAPGNVRQTARTKNRTRAQWFRHLQLMTHHHKHIHTWIKRTQPDTTQPLNTVSPPQHAEITSGESPAAGANPSLQKPEITNWSEKIFTPFIKIKSSLELLSRSSETLHVFKIEVLKFETSEDFWRARAKTVHCSQLWWFVIFYM